MTVQRKEVSQVRLRRFASPPGPKPPLLCPGFVPGLSGFCLALVRGHHSAHLVRRGPALGRAVPAPVRPVPRLYLGQPNRPLTRSVFQERLTFFSSIKLILI